MWVMSMNSAMMYLAGIALLLGLITLALGLVALRRTRKLQSDVDEARRETRMLVNALRNETHAMGSGAIGVGQRLVEVEKRLNHTVERQQEIEQRDPGALPYNYAVRLVEMGASADDLVKNCGLARAEAELITLVHREVRNVSEEEHYEAVGA